MEACPEASASEAIDFGLQVCHLVEVYRQVTVEAVAVHVLLMDQESHRCESPATAATDHRPAGCHGLESLIDPGR